jgi:hypothetical protein
MDGCLQLYPPVALLPRSKSPEQEAACAPQPVWISDEERNTWVLLDVAEQLFGRPYRIVIYLYISVLQDYRTMSI